MVLRRTKGVVIVVLVSCSSSPHESDHDANADTQGLVFEETFATLPQTFTYDPVPAFLDTTVGEPAPAIAFDLDDALTQITPIHFSGESVTAELDVAVFQSERESTVELDIHQAGPGNPLLAYMLLTVSANLTTHQSLIQAYCGRNTMYVDPTAEDQFHRMTISIDGNGMKASFNGKTYCNEPTILPVVNDLGLVIGASPSGRPGDDRVVIDNVRMFRR